jgi:hypothetical protein
MESSRASPSFVTISSLHAKLAQDAQHMHPKSKATKRSGGASWLDSTFTASLKEATKHQLDLAISSQDNATSPKDSTRDSFQRAQKSPLTSLNQPARTPYLHPQTCLVCPTYGTDTTAMLSSQVDPSSLGLRNIIQNRMKSRQGFRSISCRCGKNSIAAGAPRVLGGEWSQRRRVMLG